MKQVWGDIRATLDEKAKSYTLDSFAAKGASEMYYI
jgi:hypothetical protein